ncbi:MAG: SoxR reducing system RseC family protein [Planctomycetes bacterium]|nr:SoxR reducing system RseC family protein [Planctomycetota bacterium]
MFEFVFVDILFNLLILVMLSAVLWHLSHLASIPLLIELFSITGLDSIEMVSRVQDYWLSYLSTTRPISEYAIFILQTIYVSFIRWLYQKARNGIPAFKMLTNLLCFAWGILYILYLVTAGFDIGTSEIFSNNIGATGFLTVFIFIPTFLSWFLSRENGIVELLRVKNNFTSIAGQFGFIARYSYRNTKSVKAIVLYLIELLYGLLMIVPLILAFASIALDALKFYSSDLLFFAGLTFALIPFVLLRVYQYLFGKKSLFELVLPLSVIYGAYRMTKANDWTYIDLFVDVKGWTDFSNADDFIPMNWLMAILSIVIARKFFVIITSKLYQYSWEYFSSVTRKIRRNADQLEAYYSSPPLLLLRAFKDDMNVVRQRNQVITWLFGLDNEIIRLEEKVVDLLSSEGPVVALSNPHVEEQPLGAARKEATDETWQAEVHAYIDRAKWIVLIMGSTDNVNWEISQIIAKDMLDKLILILPTTYPDQVSITNTSSKLAELMGIESITQENKILKNAIVINFKKSQNRFVAFESKNKNAKDYLRHLNQVLFANL